jgi:hypothetical protein
MISHVAGPDYLLAERDPHTELIRLDVHRTIHEINALS